MKVLEFIMHTVLQVDTIITVAEKEDGVQGRGKTEEATARRAQIGI